MLTPAPGSVEREIADVPNPAELLSLARAGDPDAYGELCRVYETPLLRQAMRLCGNVTMAKDLAQDTLVEGWKCLRRYHGRCQFFTWLCAILLNRFRNTLRERRGLSFADIDAKRIGSAAHSDHFAGESASPDEAARLREEALIVRKCIHALPAKQQQVIYLRFFVDDSLEGIAAVLRCSVGTVKSRLFHALEKLRTMNALREQRPERTQQNGSL